MTLPTITIEVAFGDNPGAASPTWTDITAYCRSFSVRRGRSHELDRTEAGTATLLLNNSDRRFDPSYAAGAYFPNVLPMRRVRISATYNATTYRLFTGFVESWGQQWVGNNLAWTEVSAVDGFKALALRKLNTSYSQERSNVRVANVLNDVGWSTADRSLSTGVSILSSATLADVGALDHLQTVAQSENGRLYVSASGAVVFQDRHTPYNTTTVNATFGDASGDLPYADAALEYSDVNIWNEVRVQREGGTVQVRSDTATSQILYLPRTLSRTGLLILDDNEAEHAAQFLLTNYKDPYLRLTTLVIEPEKQPTTLWAQALGRELGERVLVKRNPPPSGSATLSQESFIEGIQHDVAIGEKWVTTWALSAVGIGYAVGSPIILDNATAALLDTTGTLVY